MKNMTIADALSKSKNVEKIISQAVSGSPIGNNIKDKIVAGYLSIVIQHHSSIINLVEKNLPSSAAALLRPLFEACYRCTWFALIANESQAESFNNDDGVFKLKNTYKLAKDIDRKIGYEVFHKVYEKNSHVLHGFTHGGIEQVTRQFNKDASLVTPSFRDEELVEALISSNASLAMTLIAYAKNNENTDLKKIGENIILDK